MKIHILSTFPKMFDSVFKESIIKRAIDNKIVSIHTYNLRNWASGKHKLTDDKPFGGGPGMIMMIEPIYKAVEEIKLNCQNETCFTIVTSAKGKMYKQATANKLSTFQNIIIICGHYEGIDERVCKYVADLELSIGPFVLSGGEIPAMVITDSVVRLLPGVLGNSNSLQEESHNKAGFLEAPQYTRPSEFKTNKGKVLKVPKVLLSGDHQKIKEWKVQKQTLPN